VSNTQEVTKFVASHRNNSRCFGFGLGDDASHDLVDGIAAFGVAEYALNDERLEPKIGTSNMHIFFFPFWVALWLWANAVVAVHLLECGLQAAVENAAVDWGVRGNFVACPKKVTKCPCVLPSCTSVCVSWFVGSDFDLRADARAVRRAAGHGVCHAGEGNASPELRAAHHRAQ
jgi:hypothetical protein